MVDFLCTRSPRPSGAPSGGFETGRVSALARSRAAAGTAFARSPAFCGGAICTALGRSAPSAALYCILRTPAKLDPGAHRWSPTALAPVPDGTAAGFPAGSSDATATPPCTDCSAPSVDRRRPRRGRIRHQRLVPQAGPVQVRRSLPPLTVRAAAVRCIERASGLFRQASRITNRNDVPDVDTSRSWTVTVSKRTSTSRSRRGSTGTK